MIKLYSNRKNIVKSTDQHDTILGQRKNLSCWQELNQWPPEHQALISMISCRSVDRALARCAVGHGFDYSCHWLRFFLCPTPVSCYQFSFYWTELKIHHFYSFIIKIFQIPFSAIAWLCCSTRINILQNIFYNLKSKVRDWSLSPGIIITQSGKE